MSLPYPSYLPKVWEDDVKMNGLMSLIKERAVNKVDYDKKVKFWRETIFESCVGEKDAVFDLSILKRRFRRGDRVPASLDKVIDDMRNTNDIMTLSEWKDKHSGWLGWGLSKTRSWIFSASFHDEKFLHIPTVKKQAQEMLNIYNNELREDVDCTGEVVSYSDMYERAISVIRSTENYDIVLEYLQDIGELTIGTTGTGEKVLKFKDIDSKGPLKFTEADASLVDIRKAMMRLDKEINQLEHKVKKYDEQCRSALRSGEKSRAQNFLRQRKRAEKDVKDKDVQYQKLLSMLHQISSAKNNKDVLRAYQTGTAAFKATLARQGLTPDKIHDTMDEVVNSIDEYKEIEEAMSSPVAGITGHNDEDLERELDDLLNSSNAKDTSLNLPEAPSNTFGLFETDTIEEQNLLEKRLAKLREMA